MKTAVRADCPKCNSRNWCNLGDLDDLTGTDLEALRCWKCKYVWLVEGVDEFTTLEEATIKDGLKSIS